MFGLFFLTSYFRKHPFITKNRLDYSHVVVCSRGMHMAWPPAEKWCIQGALPKRFPEKWKMKNQLRCQNYGSFQVISYRSIISYVLYITIIYHYKLIYTYIINYIKLCQNIPNHTLETSMSASKTIFPTFFQPMEFRECELQGSSTSSASLNSAKQGITSYSAP